MPHANKHIREALKYAASNGWNVIEGAAMHGERFIVSTDMPIAG